MKIELREHELEHINLGRHVHLQHLHGWPGWITTYNTNFNSLYFSLSHSSEHVFLFYVPTYIKMSSLFIYPLPTADNCLQTLP